MIILNFQNFHQTYRLSHNDIFFYMKSLEFNTKKQFKKHLKVELRESCNQ